MVLTRSGAVYSNNNIKKPEEKRPEEKKETVNGLHMLYIVSLMKALYEDDSLVLEQYAEYESLSNRKKQSVLKELQFAYELNHQSKTIY